MDLSRFYAQFREETTENLRIFSDGLLVLERASNLDEPGAREQLDAIFRAMHTIKGSSRLLGFGAIGRLAHTMENILGAIRAGTHTLDRALIDDLLKSGDALLEMTTAALEGGTANVQVDQLVDRLNRSLETGDAPQSPTRTPTDHTAASSAGAAGESSEAQRPKTTEERRARRKAKLEAEQARTETEPSPLPSSPAFAPAPSLYQPGAAEPSPPDEPQTKVSQPATPSLPPTSTPAIPPRAPKLQTVRVRVDRLDKLINLTGELVVGHQMLTDHAALLYELNAVLQAHERELLTLEALFRDLHLSPHQRQRLSQHINTLLNQGDQSSQLVRTQLDRFSRYVDQQGMLIGDLEQEVMAARMLPISTVFTTLPRAVRELANATSKEVELNLRGETTELDRKLLEALNDPLLHLVRNAVDHGIEPPDARVACGKPRQGQLEISAGATGGEVHLTIADDGRGMDPQKLREIAVQKGLIGKENAALLSDQEALELIFLPGFSSAQMITDISGRGVGMDVVRTNINELGGQVSLESQVGKGTRITLILPLTIVTTRILLIRVGKYTFALPASGCHGIIWAHQDHIRTLEGREMITHDEQVIPLMRMADLMNIEAETPFQHGNREPAVLIGSSKKLMSLLIDQLLDEREAVVKPLGPVFERQRRYNGAVQLGDGQLVLLLNPVALVQAARGIAQPRVTRSATPLQPHRRPRLLIAEDSFTTRELIRSILQSAGYDVTAAIDGHDALDKLRMQPYDLVVTDVEMPKVDGFQLTSRIREELGEHDLPVVIITSLASDEYRRRGLEAGAQAYIVKSQFNQDNLLNVIQQLLGHEG
ncbi:MAG: hybrid sensor histidine kinase/response regulator [Chloroflexaceae bacterium]|nr:hybrid sensor histidine kinase/response regulator [Chloroflexaceae bacterium]